MTKVKIFNNHESRNQLSKYIIDFAETVGSTMGPKGNRVIINKDNDVKITKDGVTVAKAIDYRDEIAKLAGSFINQAANTTNDSVGDGTTTACVLTGCLLREGMQYRNATPREIERGMEKAAKIVEEQLQKQKKTIPIEIKSMAQVARMSANDDAEIGEKIAAAIKEVGENGIITIEESKGSTVEMDVVQGMRFDRGYISHYFVSNTEKMYAELENPYILIFNKKVSNFSQILGLLEAIAQSSRPLFIIAEDVEGEALTSLILNHLHKKIKVCAVKAPGFGDRRDRMLEDIAILTKTKVINEDTGMKLADVNVDMLGSAGKIHVTKDHTTIVDCTPDGAEMDNRINTIKEEIKTCDSDYEREKLQERLAKLSGGVAAIRVGGTTEMEVKERKERFDDALHATKAAIEEGVVVGGGCALLYSYNELHKAIENEHDEGEKIGMKIVLIALKSPITQILKNAGVEYAVIINKLLEENNRDQIFDAQTMKYVNAKDHGIMDPLKVVRIAFRDAISTASIVLTSHALILPDEDDKKDDNAGAGGAGMNPYGGGMGGMGGMY